MNTVETIKSRLDEISKIEGIQILYACESGSRAWGFASPDSDFDIRFIYKRSLNEYMVLKDFSDTIEYSIKDNLDYNGWDLKKFLLHLFKSNGVMFEWLQSPVVYRDFNDFRAFFLELMKEYFNPRTAINHYLGLTKRTLLDFGEDKEVKLKKYFYILRPLMAARWIQRNGSIPPMDFSSLLDGMKFKKSVVSMISKLKHQKENDNESQRMPRITDLEVFVNSELQELESNLPENLENGKSIGKLNDIFIRMVMDK